MAHDMAIMSEACGEMGSSFACEGGAATAHLPFTPSDLARPRGVDFRAHSSSHAVVVGGGGGGARRF